MSKRRPMMRLARVGAWSPRRFRAPAQGAVRHISPTMPSIWSIALAFLVAGCNGLLQSDEIPTGVTDPAITQTPEGAMAAYNGALKQFRIAFAGFSDQLSVVEAFVPMTGLITDELQAGESLGLLDRLDAVRSDLHDMPATDDALPSNRTYERLNRVRGQVSQAIGLLTRYRPTERTLAGHLYALDGYAEVFLAELFCSGIPLSTVNFDADYTTRPGSNTAEVLTHALGLFDSALTLAGSDERVGNLARMGQGRALLGLGRYADAAAAVAAVPDDYSYVVQFSAEGENFQYANFAALRPNGLWEFNVADREAGAGLDFRSSGDPRTAATQLTPDNGYGYPIYTPNQYAADGSSPVVLASGVEARLIEAEAALQARDTTTWLEKLNHLRQTAWAGIQDCTSGTCGPGASGPLPDVTDPGRDAQGSEAPRVNLLFRERALWLFLTGHRQGDLRRLIRQYDRTPQSVYPTGAYPGGFFYGADVTAPIPPQERELNPQFTGCISRAA